MFFFKQKTAYEMRISDWSSDVCSSDLDLSMNRTDIDVPYCVFRMGLATWPQKDRDQGAGFRPTISSNTSRRAIFIISLTRSTGLIAFAASFTVSTVARYSIRPTV